MVKGKPAIICQDTGGFTQSIPDEMIKRGELKMLINGVPSPKGFIFSSKGDPAVVVAQSMKFVVQFGGGEVKVPTKPGRTSTHFGVDVGP